MPDTEFTIGADVRCSDGRCGHLIEVVVEPHPWVVTHLVVEPTHRAGLGRLVPIDLVEVVTDEIRLRCSLADFERLGRGEETGLLPGSNGGYGGYGLGQAVPGPLASGNPYLARSSFGVAGGDVADAFDPTVHDTLPPGESAVRGAPVHATDGEIGHIQGLIADRRHHHVTSVVLQEGHLWGRKRVAIPVSAVAGVDDGVRLNITKQQVEDLPAVTSTAPPATP
jgi:hypothetical protein